MFKFTEDLSNRQRNVSKGTNTCEYILLHHTGVIWEGNIKVLLGETWTKASVHFLVMQDGRSYKLADPKWITWHAWQSSWEGRIDMNRYCLGIEIEWPWFTEVQRKKAIELTEHLMAVYRIPKERVIRHKDVAPWRKVDPDESFFRLKGGITNWKLWRFLLKPKEQWNV